jgi:hypothetical protein
LSAAILRRFGLGFAAKSHASIQLSRRDRRTAKMFAALSSQSKRIKQKWSPVKNAFHAGGMPANSRAVERGDTPGN